MEKEINKNKKKKIKIKAGTNINKTFLLKREFLYKETETLLLTNIINKKVVLININNFWSNKHCFQFSKNIC